MRQRKERVNRKPNTVPAVQRVLNLFLALVLVSYGLFGIVQGQMKISPPRSRIGLVFYDRPLWLLAASMFVGALVLVSVVVDHYDRRNNEHHYRLFKRLTVALGLCLLASALVSGFYLSFTQ